MSPLTEPLDCPHAVRCAGCPLSDTPYPEQLAQKRDKLFGALAGYPALADVNVPATEAAEPNRAYRLRAKLVVAGSALGLYARDSHEVLDIPDCRVMSPRVADAVACVRRALPFEFPLLALDVREVDDGVLVTLIVAPDVAKQRVERVARALMQEHPQILGVSMSRRAPRSPQVLGSAPELVAGTFAAAHRFAPAQPFHLATPGGFVQAHAGQTDKLHARIAGTLETALGGLKHKRILELYAGAGALALRLARAGASVTIADSFAPSLAQASEAAASQRLELSVVEADAESALANASEVDALIVDPPRKGLSVAVREGLARCRPRALVYVSCEPRTLARDLAHLRALGFASQRIEPWDMIPQSDAVEALAVLTPREPAPPRILFEDERLLVLDKPAYLPTTPQGEHTRSLLQAVRLLPNASAAVPVHRLDLGTSGVCLFARSPTQVSELSEALARGQKQYLALVQGIARKRGRIDRAINDGSGVRDAVTRYERESVVGTHSLVRAFPETGRRHQIRRHLAGVGHPLLGDARYGNPAANRHFEERHGLDRPFLHLECVELDFGERTLSLTSELSPELTAVLTSLRETERGRKSRSVEAQKAAPSGE